MLRTISTLIVCAVLTACGSDNEPSASQDPVGGEDEKSVVRTLNACLEERDSGLIAVEMNGDEPPGSGSYSIEHQDAPDPQKELTGSESDIVAGCEAIAFDTQVPPELPVDVEKTASRAGGQAFIECAADAGITVETSGDDLSGGFGWTVNEEDEAKPGFDDMVNSCTKDFDEAFKAASGDD